VKRKTSSNKTEGKRNYSDTPRESEGSRGKSSKPAFYSTAKRERTSEKPEGKRDASEDTRGKFSKPSFNSSEKRERSSDRPYTPRDDRRSSSDRPYKPREERSDRPKGRRDFSDNTRRSDDSRGKFSKPSFNSSDRRERSSDRPFTPREDSRPSLDRPYKPREERSDDSRGKFSKPSFSSDRRSSSDRPYQPREERSDRPEGKREFSKSPRSSDGFKTNYGNKSSFYASDKPERSLEDRISSSDRPYKPREERSDRPEGRRDFSDNTRGKFSKTSFNSSDSRERSSDRTYQPREERNDSSESQGKREELRDRFAGRSSYKKPGSKNLASDLPFIPGMPKVHNPYKAVESKPAVEFSDEVRLNKFISNAGICSRRKADELISEGLVQVNGEVIKEMGFKVKPDDVVIYEGKKVINENKFYVLLNKPKDFITTTADERGRKTVMDLIRTATKGARVYPIGRLDRNTTGLLLLTNDGELAQHLSHPSTNVIKVYQVELDKPIKNEDLQTIRDGVELEDGFAQVDEIDITTPQVDASFVGVAIHSGKNRIVRRIFEHLGYEIKALDRVSYAGLTKKDLPRGKWRYLTEKELVYLKYLTAGSVRK
jgi:23S rRNA pseudouridine2605 synthase